MTDITAAITGLSYLRDFTKWVNGLRKDADVLTRTNEALEKVNAIYDQLQDLRSENLELRETNHELTRKLRDADDWESRRSHYQLVQTTGRAHVLQHDGKGAIVHYACPVCAEKRQLIPLQDDTYSYGVHRCPSCKAAYLG